MHNNSVILPNVPIFSGLLFLKRHGFMQADVITTHPLSAHISSSVFHKVLHTLDIVA